MSGKLVVLDCLRQMVLLSFKFSQLIEYLVTELNILRIGQQFVELFADGLHVALIVKPCDLRHIQSCIKFYLILRVC
ncbi:hypothetical protein D3C83_176440 [compost metagenome]